MKSYQIATVRGTMFLESSTTTVVASKTTQTHSYTENESVFGGSTTSRYTTTTDTDGNTATTESTTAESGQKTLRAQTSVSSSIEIEWRTTATTSYSVSQWTTTGTNLTATSRTFDFTTQSSSFESTYTVTTTKQSTFLSAVDQTVEATYTDEETSYTYESTVTQVANCYDTVIVAERNEYLLAVKSFIPAESWNGAGSSLATGMITHGTRITVSAFMHTSEAHSATATQSIAQTITHGNDTVSQTQTTSVLDVVLNALPNMTTSFPVTRSSYSFSQNNIGYDQTGKKSTTSYVFIPGSYLDADSIKRQTPKRVSTTASSLVSPRYGTGNYLVNYPQANQFPFAVGIAKGSRSDALNLDQEIYAGTCSVFGKKGVVYQGQSGAYYTVGQTTLSDVPFPLINRAEGTVGAVKNGVYSLTTSSNDSWTISGNSVTYTKSSGSITTTSSAMVSVSGEFTQSQIYATKSVFGGAPRPGETFKQYIPRGGYVDQHGSFTTFADSVTVIEHPQTAPTKVYRYVPYLTVGNEALFWMTVERNQIANTAVWSDGISTARIYEWL